MKHPADMSEHEQSVWNSGFTHMDELFRKGLNTDETKLYIEGLRARMEQEQYRALHPGIFTYRKDY